MKAKLVSICLLICISLTNKATLYSAANYVELKNGEIREFVGNGFLLKHQGKTYGVTAKHVLFELRSPDVTHINIKNAVKTWHFKPFNSDKKGVTLGRLLNENDQEKLDMQVLSRDYLVFEVPSQDTDLMAVELSNTELRPSELLTAYGCSYSNQQTCQQNSYKGAFKSHEPNNLRVKLDGTKPGTLRGLSGGPVLNSQNQLVGVVSNVMPSLDGKGMDFAPANLVYLKQLLETLP